MQIISKEQRINIVKGIYNNPLFLGDLRSGDGDGGQAPVPVFILNKLRKIPLFQLKRGQAA